jgi:5,10-methylene-tetrahydrofolate dehydrogenase/methenyl tetrahydrofolate cyclohydrolase
LKAGRNSATIVWAKLVIIAGGLVAVLDKIADLAGDPTLTAQIQQYATPQMVGYVTIAIMLVNVWARLRTLGK